MFGNFSTISEEEMKIIIKLDGSSLNYEERKIYSDMKLRLMMNLAKYEKTKIIRQVIPDYKKIKLNENVSFD